jgi:hypothetical protein
MGWTLKKKIDRMRASCTLVWCEPLEAQADALKEIL